MLVYYWLWGSATFALILFVYRIVPATISGNGSLLQHAWYYLAPDCLRFRHLAAIGHPASSPLQSSVRRPMLRIRRALIQLADGEPSPIIELRESDHWQDIAEAVEFDFSEDGGVSVEIE